MVVQIRSERGEVWFEFRGDCDGGHVVVLDVALVVAFWISRFACIFVCMSALVEFCLGCLYYLQYERGVRFDVNIMLLVWSDAAWTFFGL